MIFAHPELLVLAILAPAVVFAAARLWRRRLRAAEAWTSRALWSRLFTGYSASRMALSVALLAIAVAAAAVALAQPRWGETSERVEREGVDVAFVLDASLSMGALDVQPSRLAVAETLLRRMVQAMPGNRVALIGSEGDGVVMAPLTTDAAVVDLLLDGIEPGSLPVPGTELGAALDRLAEVFPVGDDAHRAAVLISDGEDHGGGLADRLEALVAAGITVHTIGVGTPQGAPVPIPGAPGENKRREDGTVVISRLDEEILETIARGTGGIYLRATGSATDLTPVLTAIAGMETQAIDAELIDTLAERFQWPLALAALALTLFLGISPFRPAPRETFRERDLEAA